MSNSLLEKIIFKSQKINFDLSKSFNSNMLSENIKIDNPYVDTPIDPSRGEWKSDNDMLSCNFLFKNEKHVIFFINQILEKAIKKRHHPEILINHKNVIIKLTTHDLNQITEIDIEMAKFISDVYDDVNFIMDI